MNPNEFNLERAILDWRRQLATGGIKSPDLLDELEAHLREDIEQRMRSGIGTDEVFETAVRQMGQLEILRSEFKKSRRTLVDRLKQFLFERFGVLEPQLATNMNTTLSENKIEPRLATYSKAAAFALPAVAIWLFTALFLLPKVNEMCQAAGMNTYHLNQAPAFFQAFAGVGELMVFLTAHGFVVCAAVAALLILLEWRSRNWPRYRRATFGVGAFLLNALVLISITMMVISAILAAQGLLPNAR